MKTFLQWSVATIGALCVTTASAQVATTIDFDDIVVARFEPIVSGYAGMNWFNWGVNYAQRPALAGTGYAAGSGGSANVAFNWDAQPASFGSPTSFLLRSLDLTAAWNDDLNVIVTGWLDRSLVGTRSFVVSTYSPTTFTFDWSLVDRVTVSSFGGVHVGGPYSGAHVALDNVVFGGADAISGPVPEPETYALMLMGLAGVAWVARRRRQR